MTAIELVLDHYGVSYRSGGGEQTIRCPVHDDRLASASLNLDKQVFNCHACGASGSVYDLVMAREELDFASAKQTVEGITGIVDSGVREESRPRLAVSPGSGYRPSFRRKVSTRSRRRPDF